MAVFIKAFKTQINQQTFRNWVENNFENIHISSFFFLLPFVTSFAGYSLGNLHVLEKRAVG